MSLPSTGRDLPARRFSAGLARVALVVAGGALGLWMALDGLSARVLGVYLPELGGGAALAPALAGLGLDPLGLAWPLIVVGLGWWGGLAGLGLSLPWGRKTVLAVGLLSLLYLGPGTVLGALALAGLLAGGGQDPAAREA